FHFRIRYTHEADEAIPLQRILDQAHRAWDANSQGHHRKRIRQGTPQGQNGQITWYVGEAGGLLIRVHKIGHTPAPPPIYELCLEWEGCGMGRAARDIRAVPSPCGRGYCT